MNDELRTTRIVVLMTAEEVERLDDWRFSNRAASRSEAVRGLIVLGLEAPGKKPGKG